MLDTWIYSFRNSEWEMPGVRLQQCGKNAETSLSEAKIEPAIL